MPLTEAERINRNFQHPYTSTDVYLQLSPVRIKGQRIPALTLYHKNFESAYLAIRESHDLEDRLNQLAVFIRESHDLKDRPNQPAVFVSTIPQKDPHSDHWIIGVIYDPDGNQRLNLSNDRRIDKKITDEQQSAAGFLKYSELPKKIDSMATYKRLAKMFSDLQHGKKPQEQAEFPNILELLCVPEEAQAISSTV